VEPLRAAVPRALPLAVAEREDRVRDAPVDAEQQAEHELRHRRGVLPGAVRHVDAATAGRAHVDGAELGARAHDEVKLLGLVDGLGGHLRRANDEDADA